MSRSKATVASRTRSRVSSSMPDSASSSMINRGASESPYRAAAAANSGSRAAQQHGVHPRQPAPDLVDAMSQVIGDLLHEGVAEHTALFGREDLLAVGDLRPERVEDLPEGLLPAAFGDVDQQQAVLATACVRAHVGLRQLAVEQLHPALHLDPELARR